MDQKARQEPLGYKLHASVDKRCKLIRKIAITHAAVADTTVFEELLDLSNTNGDVYADRGYPSIEREARLTGAGWRMFIQRKGGKDKPIAATQERRNRRIAETRARVEHVFAGLARMGQKTLRSIGLARATRCI